ncbi:TIM-barrel domain-containing protein [Microbacterium flavum]|uniref:TIM-barrel domain-containing protein n=1 Tax=Microbacterium flavum TaxID=415216 RepID=UPI0024AD13B1|nr:TIM-barrel domain-containing protein [Microbacterium flavum]
MSRFAVPPAPARPASVVTGDGYRITVLTSRLLRLEWSPTGTFVDRRTPLVITRDFATPQFEVVESDDLLEIRTEHLYLAYDRRSFSPAGLSVSLRQRAQSAFFSTWHYGDDLPYTGSPDGNLGGTTRTLDGVDGATGLDPGILARYGFAVVDDSSSVEVGDGDWVGPRPGGGKDLYFFGHGNDYRAALDDFHVLTGPTPLVPRGILGNWWSRYWRYSADGYLDLMDGFAADGIPFSVAVIDMDWHLVDIDPRLGTGWTGYTWNRELFPHPEQFLADLHERGMLVTLNVHPADGVRAHEDAYPAVAAALGLDPATQVAIPFDITSPAFVDAYLRHLHHPIEEQGVDFWWLDWQSGSVSRIAGLDPLWMLNDIHFHDSAREGKRPLTFSRYAGLGSHRYPIGFSGDAITTWESLAFQPRFTAIAANIGYTWWSHDIGGHIGGIKSNELTTRWMQFGVFSPINRLHSGADPFHSKEPAQFPEPHRSVMTRFLRLRHLLVPYLYTAAWRAHADGVGVVRPMYHDHPDEDAAYRVPDQYFFGDDMIVAPITAPVDPVSGLGAITVWLPRGGWVDLFTGARYEGGRRLVLHRSLDHIPVLVRRGAAVPMLADPQEHVEVNPETLVLRLVPGAGASSLFEDDGSAAPTPAERTTIRVVQTPHAGASMRLRIEATGPAASHERALVLDLAGVASIGGLSVDGRTRAERGDVVRADGTLAPALRVPLGRLDLSAGVEIELSEVAEEVYDPAAAVFEILDRAQIEFALKHAAYDGSSGVSGVEFSQFLDTLSLPASLRGALIEAVARS